MTSSPSFNARIKKEDIVLARLASKRRRISIAEVNECIKIQTEEEKRGKARRLLEILIDKDYLKRYEIHDLIAEFQKETGSPLDTSYLPPLPDGGPTPPSTDGTATAVHSATRAPTRPGTRTGSATQLPTQPSLGGEPIRIGDAIGPYEILEEIARGGMGVVFKAQHRDLKRIVAIKMIRGGTVESQEQLARFHREAKVLVILQHPNIVSVFERGLLSGCPYFITNFIAGRALDELVKKRWFTTRESYRLFEQVTRILAFGHERGVIHRDIKPTNIMLGTDNNAYVLDYGLAKSVENLTLLTRTGEAIGTPYYMSPEQVKGEQDRIDARSDIYSLGVVLYQAMTGKLPFTSESTIVLYSQIVQSDPLPPRKLARVDHDLETICLKCLAKEPSGRYQNATALADDLARYTNNQPIAARPPPVLSTLVRKTFRCHRKLLLITTLALITTLILHLTWTRSRGGRQREEERLLFHASRIQRLLSLVPFDPREATRYLDNLSSQLSSSSLEKLRAQRAFEENFYRLHQALLEPDPPLEKAREYLETMSRLAPLVPPLAFSLSPVTLVEKYRSFLDRHLTRILLLTQPPRLTCTFSPSRGGNRSLLSSGFDQAWAAAHQPLFLGPGNHLLHIARPSPDADPLVLPVILSPPADHSLSQRVYRLDLSQEEPGTTYQPFDYQASGQPARGDFLLRRSPLTRNGFSRMISQPAPDQSLPPENGNQPATALNWQQAVTISEMSLWRLPFPDEALFLSQQPGFPSPLACWVLQCRQEDRTGTILQNNRILPVELDEPKPEVQLLLVRSVLKDFSPPALTRILARGHLGQVQEALRVIVAAPPDSPLFRLLLVLPPRTPSPPPDDTEKLLLPRSFQTLFSRPQVQDSLQQLALLPSETREIREKTCLLIASINPRLLPEILHRLESLPETRAWLPLLTRRLTQNQQAMMESWLNSSPSAAPVEYFSEQFSLLEAIAPPDLRSSLAPWKVSYLQHAALLYLERGKFLRDQGKREAAVPFFFSALSLHPDFSSAYFLASTLQSLGKEEEARNTFEQAVSLFFQHPRGDANEKELLYETFVTLSNHYQILAEKFSGSDKSSSRRYLQRSITYLSRGIRLNPAAAEGYKNLALAFNTLAVMLSSDPSLLKQSLAYSVANLHRLWIIAPTACAELYEGKNLPGLLISLKMYSYLDHLPPAGYFAIAEYYAYQNQAEEALDWLEKAFAHGFRSYDKIEQVPFFASLRQHPRYLKLASLYPPRRSSSPPFPRR